MFKLNPDASYSMSYRVGSFRVEPAKLVRVFGKPGESDGYKVSGEYHFESEKGEVFHLYDYKYTSLYDPRQPHPAAFWSENETASEFSIGGVDETDVKGFIDWLTNQVYIGSAGNKYPGMEG